MLALLVVLLILYIILPGLLQRARPPARNLPQRESSGYTQGQSHAGRGPGPSRMHLSDDARPPQVVVPAKPSDARGASTSSKGRSRGQRQVSTPQPVTVSGYATSPAITGASTASLSSLGPSFVEKFAGLKVDTMHSRLASPAGAPRAGPTTRSARTPSLSPLTTPPSSPLFPPSPSQTPVPFQSGSRGQPLASRCAVDFSLYQKKIRALTKSPRKLSPKSAGKRGAEAATDVTTITTWFYKLSANSQLLANPPDLTGHPEHLSLGDIYFDRVGDTYQLWLWSLGEAGALHWKQIPFGYQRGDGKHLIVTRKNHLLSWVTPSYYKQIGSSDGRSFGEGEE